MLCYSIASNQKLRKFLEKIKMVFGENDPQHHRFWQSDESLKEFVQKPRGDTLLHKFLQGIWSHTQRGDRTNTSAYGIPKETVAAILMLYKTRNSRFTHRMETRTSSTLLLVFCKGIHLPYYQFIMCPDYVLRKSIKENGFSRKEKKEKRQEANDIPQKLLRTQTMQMT